MNISRQQTPFRPPELAADFLRGFIAAGVLASVQDRPQHPKLDRRTARLALQGGSALATGTAAARAWRQGRNGQALTRVAVGVALVVAIEHLLQDPLSKENHDEQEKA